MSVEKERLKEMRKAAMTYAKKNKLEHEPVKDLYYDLSIDAADVPAQLAELVKYGPYGQGNAPVVFEIRDFRLLPGRDGQLKSKLGTGGLKLNSGAAEAVSFDSKLSEDLLSSTALSYTLYGTLSYSYFRGEARPQIGLLGFKEEKAATAETPLMRALREKAGKA